MSTAVTTVNTLSGFIGPRRADPMSGPAKGLALGVPLAIAIWALVLSPLWL